MYRPVAPLEDNPTAWRLPGRPADRGIDDEAIGADVDVGLRAPPDLAYTGRPGRSTYATSGHTLRRRCDDSAWRDLAFL